MKDDKPDLDKLRAIDNAATPGPWLDNENPIDEYWAELNPNDAVFIATARTAIPQLIDWVRELEKELEQHRRGKAKDQWWPSAREC